MSVWFGKQETSGSNMCAPYKPEIEKARACDFRVLKGVHDDWLQLVAKLLSHVSRLGLQKTISLMTVMVVAKDAHTRIKIHTCMHIYICIYTGSGCRHTNRGGLHGGIKSEAGTFDSTFKVFAKGMAALHWKSPNSGLDAIATMAAEPRTCEARNECINNLCCDRY
jgi:hypothetical protein